MVGQKSTNYYFGGKLRRDVKGDWVRTQPSIFLTQPSLFFSTQPSLVFFSHIDFFFLNMQNFDLKQ